MTQGFDIYAEVMAGAGDVDGDGYADFVIGDWFSNAAFLYRGSAIVGELAWNGSSPAQRIDLTMPGGVFSSFGTVVASAGDVDGDGYADFSVSDAGSGDGIGTVHLYLGSAAVDPVAWNQVASAARIDLASPAGADFHFGSALASAGDVNGDGYGEVLVSSDGTEVIRLYLGSAVVSAAGWNGTSSVRRIDLAIPGGSTSGAVIDRMASGSAYLYLGSAALDGSGWTGSSPSMRRDLLGPDGAGGHFGTAVAQ